jgi:hypothetical protein
MKQEKLTIAGRKSLAIPGTWISQDHPGRRLAILFPGLTYRSSMPVLYYTRQLLLARGYDVLAIDYAYDQIPDLGPCPKSKRWLGSGKMQAAS